MRVLLDNNVNVRFGRLLTGHEVVHVQEIGWENLRNGELIAAAERTGYGALITADKQMRHQQNVADRKIGIVVLNSLLIKWAHIAPLAPRVLAVLDSGFPEGGFIVIHPEDEE